MKFEVTSHIYTLNNFDYKHSPDYTQGVGLSINNKLIENSPTGSKKCKFYFLYEDILFSITESKDPVPLKLDTDKGLYILMYDQGWHVADFNKEKIEYIKLKSNDIDKQYVVKIQVSCVNEEGIRIGSSINILGKDVKIFLPSGSVYEEGGEEYLTSQQVKSTRNILVVLSVIAWTIFMMSINFFISSSITHSS